MTEKQMTEKQDLAYRLRQDVAARLGQNGGELRKAAEASAAWLLADGLLERLWTALGSDMVMFWFRQNAHESRRGPTDEPEREGTGGPGTPRIVVPGQVYVHYFPGANGRWKDIRLFTKADCLVCIAIHDAKEKGEHRAGLAWRWLVRRWRGHPPSRTLTDIAGSRLDAVVREFHRRNRPPTTHRPPKKAAA